MNNIGTKIKQVRIKNLLTQKKFADKLGIIQQHLYRYEAGLITPGVTILRKLRVEFEVDLNWLLAED